MLIRRRILLAIASSAFSSVELRVAGSSLGGGDHRGAYGSNYNNYGQQQQQFHQYQQQREASQQPSHQERAPLLLPPGWTEHFDPASRLPYYYNAKDGTTTWDRPPPVAESEQAYKADSDSKEPVESAEYEYDAAPDQFLNGTNQSNHTDNRSEHHDSYDQSVETINGQAIIRSSTLIEQDKYLPREQHLATFQPETRDERKAGIQQIAEGRLDQNYDRHGEPYQHYQATATARQEQPSHYPPDNISSSQGWASMNDQTQDLPASRQSELAVSGALDDARHDESVQERHLAVQTNPPPRLQTHGFEHQYSDQPPRRTGWNMPQTFESEHVIREANGPDSYGTSNENKLPQQQQQLLHPETIPVREQPPLDGWGVPAQVKRSSALNIPSNPSPVGADPTRASPPLLTEQHSGQYVQQRHPGWGTTPVRPAQYPRGQPPEQFGQQQAYLHQQRQQEQLQRLPQDENLARSQQMLQRQQLDQPQPLQQQHDAYTHGPPQPQVHRQDIQGRPSLYPPGQYGAPLQQYQPGQYGSYGQPAYGQYQGYYGQQQGRAQESYQLVETGTSAVRDVLGKTWQGILGFRNRTKEVYETTRDTVANSALQASQTLTSTSSSKF
jgi:hypothetical protein